MTTLEYAQSYFADRTVLQTEKLPSGWYLILCKFGNQFVVWEWDGKSSQGIRGEYFHGLRDALAYFDSIVEDKKALQSFAWVKP